MTALLDRKQLAARWQMPNEERAGRKAKQLGLRPFQPGKKELYLLERVEEVERRRTAAPEDKLTA